MEGYYSIAYTPNGWIMHHGVLGMKWGVRRFQKEDGSYTSAGQKRYEKKLNKLSEKTDKYDSISKIWDADAKAKRIYYSKLGPVQYGMHYSQIHKSEVNAKQFKRYADYSRKRTQKYIDKLSKDYDIKFDIASGKYTLKKKQQNKSSTNETKKKGLS